MCKQTQSRTDGKVSFLMRSPLSPLPSAHPRRSRTRSSAQQGTACLLKAHFIPAPCYCFVLNDETKQLEKSTGLECAQQHSVVAGLRASMSKYHLVDSFGLGLLPCSLVHSPRSSRLHADGSVLHFLDFCFAFSTLDQKKPPAEQYANLTLKRGKTTQICY